MDALVVQQPIVARDDVVAKRVGKGLVVFEMKRKDELLTDHTALWPDVVSREDAEFLHGQAFENGFDVLRVDVLPFFRDDHVFLTSGKNEMAGLVEAAEVAGF